MSEGLFRVHQGHHHQSKCTHNLQQDQNTGTAQSVTGQLMRSVRLRTLGPEEQKVLIRVVKVIRVVRIPSLHLSVHAI